MSAGNPEMSQGSPPAVWAPRWLSDARLAPYLSCCDNDVETALGRALMGDISYFEIALRNAYDRTLSNNFQGTAHWLFDENSPVRKPILHKSHRGIERDVNLVNRRSIEQARARAHDPSDPNQVISNLTLGFWVHMSDRMHEREVWIP